MLYYRLKPIVDSPLLVEGDVFLFFVNKLKEETGLTVKGRSSIFAKELGLPSNEFHIDDVNISVQNFEKIATNVLDNFSNVPILDGNSLRELGYEVEFLKSIPNDEVNRRCADYMEQNHLQYLVEAVLYKNMTDDQKAATFNEYLYKIGAAGKELIICDPYLFSDATDSYCDFLTKILKLSHVKDIVVITDKRHFKQDSFNKVHDKLNEAPYYEKNTWLATSSINVTGPATIDVKFSKEYHDRFWIADRKKGFCVGTSFNGVGKKISCINYLPDDDVTDLVGEFQLCLCDAHQQELA